MVEQIQEVPQTTQPVQEVPVEPKKKSKLPTIAVLLIAVLLIGVGGVYAVKRFNQPKGCTTEARVCPDGSAVGRAGPNCEFAPCPTLIPSATQAPDETADWRTYTNNTHGYSLQIPAEYEVVRAEDYANPENSVGIENKKKKINIGFVTDPWTHVCANSSSCEKMRLISLKLMGKNYSAQEYYVSRGYPYAGYSFQIESGITTEKKTTLCLKVDYDQPENLEEIFQILSTFKFLDQTDETANWKTYTSEKYGYSFKYPQNWDYKERDNTSVIQEIWLGTQDQENLVTFYVNKDKYLGMTKSGKVVTCQERGGNEIVVGGIKGLVEYIPGAQNNAQDWVCFEKGNRSYEFQHVYSTVINSKGIFNQILSTFKFL